MRRSQGSIFVAYYLKTHLNGHMKRKHVTSFDKECEQCGKVFPTTSTLNDHKQHHNKSPCLLCGKFLAKKHVKAHKCKKSKKLKGINENL